MAKPIISADSHVVEPPGTYVDRIDKKFLDRAPRMVHDEQRGDIFVIDGSPRNIPLSLISAAGKKPEELSAKGAVFEKLHRGGWEPQARLRDQDADGVSAEVIYPSVGMELCGNPDMDYKKACMDAYNLWLAEFCAEAPQRLIGQGQTAMRTPDDGIEDMRKIKEMGLRGVMLPGLPGVEDYDSPIYGEFWEASVQLEMPLSFHILTASEDLKLHSRGGKLNGFMNIIRSNQDVMGMLVFGGVFMRHPKLRIVCVEADAGWVPHFSYRMDHAYKRHRHWMKGDELEKLPSEYFHEHIYLTFQDDFTAFQLKDLLNVERLMWANDFPHSDSTWPNSQEVIRTHMANLSEGEKERVLHDNVAELYQLAV
ncbi:MAG: amidohydrolase family protein [SAR324 cluster bacterium]|nr:amidohydrolase family protein [SAR324 cluster bacterium]